jgi:hypothetical protein
LRPSVVPAEFAGGQAPLGANFRPEASGNIPDLDAGISTGFRVASGPVIQALGAASISMGRTVHEVRDEMCRAMAR